SCTTTTSPAVIRWAGWSRWPLPGRRRCRTRCDSIAAICGPAWKPRKQRRRLTACWPLCARPMSRSFPRRELLCRQRLTWRPPPVPCSASSALDVPARRIQLNGNCRILSLGSMLEPTHFDTEPFRMDIISVLSPTDIWHKRVNPALDDFEVRSTLSLTAEYSKVLHHARGRNLLSSTVYAYFNSGETVVDFGNGGSEAMTSFINKDGDDRVSVGQSLS